MSSGLLLRHRSSAGDSGVIPYLGQHFAPFSAQKARHAETLGNLLSCDGVLGALGCQLYSPVHRCPLEEPYSKFHRVGELVILRSLT